MPKKIDMVGKKFERLIVIKEDGRDGDGKVLWECLCTCGTVKTINGCSLRQGLTKSCGCLQDEIRRETVKQISSKTHGMTKTPTYSSWKSMKQRCNNPKSISYNYYGGRGIKMCKRWLKFENFLEDMGVRPEKLTLEREDNSGDYEPGNCVWADIIVQSRNKRVRDSSKTDIRGTYFNNKSKKYLVKITANNKQYHIGCYLTSTQALLARKQAEQKYWGQCASI